MLRRVVARLRRRATVIVIGLLATLGAGTAASAVTIAVHSSPPEASSEGRIRAAGGAAIQPAVLAVRDAHRAYTTDVRDQHVAARAGELQAGVKLETFARIGDRTATKPAPPPPPPAPPAPAVATGSVWDRLARCESGGNWAASHGLYEGGLQFHPSTWDRHRDADMPDAAYKASREQQIVVGKRVQAAQGWSAWPSCASKLGLIG